MNNTLAFPNFKFICLTFVYGNGLPKSPIYIGYRILVRHGWIIPDILFGSSFKAGERTQCEK